MRRWVGVGWRCGGRVVMSASIRVLDSVSRVRLNSSTGEVAVEVESNVVQEEEPPSDGGEVADLLDSRGR